MKLLDKNNNIIKIENEDLNDAKLSTKDFADGSTRKRAFINVLAARLAVKMFFSKKLEASNAYSLYSINNVLKDYDISDVYLNDIKIDARLVFDRNEIFIPKSHFQNELLPDVYVVLELKKDFSQAEFLGFLEPKDINKNNQNKDYYFYDYKDLKDSGSIKDFFSGFTANRTEISETDFSQAEQLFLPSSDGLITPENKLYLIKQLKNSRDLRERFVEYENFEMISKVTVKDETIVSDGVLGIIGAQDVFEDEELSLKDSKAVIIDEVLTDLLDEEIGSSFAKPKQEDNNEDLSFLEELETETTKTKSESKALKNGATALAAGAGIAGLAAAGSMAAAASAAEIQSSITKTGVDALAKGIDTGSSIIENTASAIGKAAVNNNFTQSFENDLSSNDFDFENSQAVFDDTNLMEGLPELKLDELKEFIDEPKSNSYETNNSSYEEFDLNELDTSKEAPEEPQKTESALSSLASASFKILGDSEEEIKNNDFNYETIEEIEPSADSELSFDDIKKQTEALTDIDMDIDMDMDLGMDKNKFQKPEESQFSENIIDEKIEEIDFDNKFVIIDDEEFMPKAENESKSNKTEDAQNSSEDIDFEVDDFLKGIDMDMSEDDSNLLGDDSNLFEDTMNLLGDDNTEGFKTNASSPTSQSENSEIQMLFEGEHNAEISEDKEDKIIPSSSIKQDKKMVIAASIASVILISLVVGGSMLHNKNKDTNLPTNMATTPITTEGQTPAGLDQNSIAEQDQQALGPDLNAPEQQQATPDGSQSATPTRDMGQAVSDVFSSEPVNSTISKIAWEVPEDLAYNDGFRSYLQVAGKNLKLNLQNDLLLATEMAYTNKVVVDLGIGKDGSLISEKIVTSSGSKQIDKIVLQSVKETLKYLRMPSSELGGRSAMATLIVNF